MKIGIAGFAGCGKSTVFQWLTGDSPDPSKILHGQLGSAEVPDDRLQWLTDYYRPKKEKPVFAKLEFLDTPGLLTSERKDNPRRLGIMRDAGGLLIVLNGFSGGDLNQELRNFREELVIADLEIVSNRIARIKEQHKKPRPAKQREADEIEMALLGRVESALEQGKDAGSLGLKPEEEKTIRSFQLLTLKSVVAFINQGETGDAPVLKDVNAKAVGAPVQLEMELQELSDDERSAFMEDMGLTKFSRDEILRTIFYEMGQIVFFTVGDDECRAWPIPRGASAVEGAAQIHTDLAKGFIRGEVVPFDDFKRVGSMKEAKAQGVYRLESKTYVVQDGDILHIRAST